MNNILEKHWKPIVCSLCIIIFICIAYLLTLNNLSGFDNVIYRIVTSVKCEPVTLFFKVITFLCSKWFIIFLTLTIMIFSKNKKRAFFIALNVLLCYFLNQTLKLIFARERPLNINLITEKGFSFPSGHSMISVAYYGFIAYIIAHTRMKKKKKRLYVISLMILVLLIGISRIYLGVHFASDVLAGYALATAYLIIYILLFYKKMEM
jgi:undecaprenyl-diphosphatase